MTKVELWPPPAWTEVIILWKDITEGPRYPIKEILEWLSSHPGGRYHVHGYKSTEGFAFRFESENDATLFRLRWE